ncbi:LmbE family protein [Thalassoporum mexicanum PCC 7367]|uniref:PIG-L deacetylase family protein n=1 Tax=Thalassoporum mexicanum TaxID=3457544 RepID=UPI00029FCEEB|nr:PIG-L deacetylase family protein [Pseudanabaena sp. PCC 7367]AFY69683.1 LmbE family protein [Pseudanabaena sp. PCC 7367]
MNILVVAAHPDDEMLGCGGTIARHTRVGDQVHILILAEGATSRDPQRFVAKRQEEMSALATAAQQARQIVGAHSTQLHDFPDNRLDHCDRLDVVKVVEQKIDQIQPELIYTHHGGDLNIDHQYAYQAVITAARPLPRGVVKTILCFEVASSTEWQVPPSFLPNWYVDITETLDTKLAALVAYHMEMREFPHARSIDTIEHLARWRGANVGVAAAEAFMLARHII